MKKDSKFKQIFLNLRDTLVYFGWASILVFGIVVVINLAFISSIVSQRDALIFKEQSSAEQDMETINFHMSNLLNGFHNDIDVVRDSNEASAYLENPNATTLSEFEAMAYRISSNKKEFLSLTLIDLNGDELFKIQRDGDALVIANTLSNVDISDYVSDVSSILPHLITISPFELVDDKPTFYFFTPLDNLGVIDSYILVAYDANEFLSIFDVFAQDRGGFYDIGLVNDDNVWLINLSTQTFNEITDINEKDAIVSSIINDSNTLTYSIELDTVYISETTSTLSFFELYATVDTQSAINSSQNIIVVYPWLLGILDIILLIMIFTMGYLFRRKSDDRILLNANMYLSDRNKDGVIITDNQIKTHYVNKAFESFYGYSLADMLNKNPREVIGASDIKFTYKTSYLDDEFQENVWNKTRDGVKLLKYLRIKKESNLQGKVKHYIGIYSEPNVHFPDFDMNFLNEISALMLPIFTSRQIKLGKSVIKLIRVENEDTYRYAVFLKKHLKSEEMVAIPYQNYILVYTELDEDQPLESCIQNMDKLVEKFRSQTNVSPYFNQNYAVTIADEERDTFSKLIEAAVIGLEVAKNDPQAKYKIFRNEMIDFIHREKEVRDALNIAFEMNEFFMNYQLQIDVETKEFIGVEALLRWESQTLGMIYPDEFLPLIENGYYINQLSSMVIKNVIKDFIPYVDKLPEGFKISLNLTSFDFENSYILNELLEMIEASPLPASLFTFEITESNYLENINAANKVIQQLHHKGIYIGIDDFGTGYASISSLKSIEVDYVKIDKIFLSQYPSEDDGKLFRIISELIHNFKKPIVVEGVETKEHLDLVKKTQCQFAQGYYFSRPALLSKIIKQIIKD